jgi:hypothetical protein
MTLKPHFVPPSNLRERDRERRLVKDFLKSLESVLSRDENPTPKACFFLCFMLT